MEVITSWDDGTSFDLRMIELLKKYEIQGIFFIPIISDGFKNLDRYEGFEIGCHTFNHPQDLKKLNHAELNKQIIFASEVLKRELVKLNLQEELNWFCYPRGRYNQTVIDKVKLAGFKKARTTNIKDKNNNYELGGYHCYQRKEYKNTDWLQYIKKEIDKKPETIHIWGHSAEINKYKEWDKLEDLFKYIYENTHC